MRGSRFKSVVESKKKQSSVQSQRTRPSSCRASRHCLGHHHAHCNPCEEAREKASPGTSALKLEQRSHTATTFSTC